MKKFSLYFFLCPVVFTGIAFQQNDVHAQNKPVSVSSTQPQATYQAPSVTTAETPAFELALPLVDALRAGSHVIYLKHTETKGLADKKEGTQWWKNCASTDSLSEPGIAQAASIGKAIKDLGIPVFQLYASEYCRATHTASSLGLGNPIQTNADLNAAPAQYAVGKKDVQIEQALRTLFLLTRPGLPNVLLIGDSLPVPASPDPVLSVLREGEAAIFKVDSPTRFHFVGRLSANQWPQLVVANQTRFKQQTPSPAVAAAPTPPPPMPMIDPAKELRGMPLVEALRKGGYVLYMRHAQSNVGGDGNLIQTPMWWENCSIQRNISEMGKEQARKIGAAIRELKIPVAEIKAAQFCRTRDTAHAMGLGAIEVTEDLNHSIGQRKGFDINVARFKHLVEMPAKGSNTILVSHTHGSSKPEEKIMGQIGEAEMAVYRPDGKGGTELVARIPVPEWDNLIKIVNATNSPQDPAKK